jgi:hypothetical protein
MSHSAPLDATLNDWSARGAIGFSFTLPDTFHVAGALP